VFLIPVPCFLMCIMFYVSFIWLHVYAFAIYSMVHCGSAIEPGASGLPYYCTSICVRSWCNLRASLWIPNQKKKYNLHHHLSPVIRLGLRDPRKKERQTLSNNNHSNLSIHCQHTNTPTSKQHSCVQGPLREYLPARHFQATLLLYLHLCAFLM